MNVLTTLKGALNLRTGINNRLIYILEKKIKMRTSICILIFLAPLFSFAQNQSSVDSLKALLEINEKKIQELLLANENLERQITIFQSQKNQLNNQTGVKAFIKSSAAKLRSEPSSQGLELKRFEFGDEILILTIYNDTYYEAASDNLNGFISRLYVEESPEVLELRESYLSTNNPKLLRYIKLYGSETAYRLMRGEYWIGMSKDMARRSLGSPDKINSSTGSYGTHDQWVYNEKGVYLYFEDGVLTSYQN